jgi:SNF2 family DNA or RNA helicase
MTTIHGELTADGEQIVLIAGGLDLEGVALAARRLKALTPLFTASDPKGALVVTTSWAAVCQLSATFGASWRPGPRLAAWVSQQIQLRTSVNLLPLDYTPPAPLTPYPWQVTGAQMINALGRVLITDEPGTGKTPTTVLGLVERAIRGVETFPAVVVCPASVIDAWVETWSAWAPWVKVVAWRGTPKQRRALAGTAEVYVTSYETARVDAPAAGTKDMRVLAELGARSLVVDEAHLIKNPQAERSKTVRRLAKRAETVVALTGTPITHHPGDLWPTLNALEPGAHPSRERWVRRYCEVIPGDYDEQVLGLLPATEPEFRLSLLGQLRRVAKADVLDKLPPKVYSVRTVDLPAAWRKSYDSMEAEMLAELPSADGRVEELSVMSVLAQLTRLAQLASAAADVETTTELDETTGEEKVHVKVALKAPSWKVDALLEVLAERPGSPVVAFAPSRQLVMLAGEQAAAAGHRVGYVVGGQTPAERTAAVAAFQAGQLDLLCVTTGAGGVGLTLTAARTCVFLQRPWSLVEAMQAEDRLHRIGAEGHESIEVIDIVARNTIDSRVRAVLRERAGQLADLVQDPRVASELLGGSDRSARDATPLAGLHLPAPSTDHLTSAQNQTERRAS